MINVFAGRDKPWLIEQRNALQDALASATGSHTHLGISGGLYDEFKDLSCSEIAERLHRILYALFKLDPANYANPYLSKVMTVSTVYPRTGTAYCCP